MSVILEHQSLNVENLLNPESPKGDMMKKNQGCVCIKYSIYHYKAFGTDLNIANNRLSIKNWWLQRILRKKRQQ